MRLEVFGQHSAAQGTMEHVFFQTQIIAQLAFEQLLEFLLSRKQQEQYPSTRIEKRLNGLDFSHEAIVAAAVVRESSSMG
jgi:hypothetical protein